jgi:hypothetical protein
MADITQFLKPHSRGRCSWSELASGDSELALRIDGKLPMRRCVQLTAQVEFEAVGHHDDGLRSVAVLEAHEAKCGGAIGEEAPTNPLLVLNHPIASAVLTDHEHWRP